MYEPDRAEVDRAVDDVLTARRGDDRAAELQAARNLVLLLDCADVLAPYDRT